MGKKMLINFGNIGCKYSVCFANSAESKHYIYRTSTFNCIQNTFCMLHQDGLLLMNKIPNEKLFRLVQ